jgi:hypothetical protein
MDIRLKGVVSLSLMGMVYATLIKIVNNCSMTDFAAGRKHKYGYPTAFFAFFMV